MLRFTRPIAGSALIESISYVLLFMARVMG
jgi:hypothetical protein